MRPMSRLACLLASTSMMLTGHAALAQDQTANAAAPSEGQVFLPAEFSRYAPRTALDMVRNLPGFQIQTADTSVRGLGQATGNILLNGQRIASKTSDASAELSRIDAGNVLRIELIDGAKLNVPGLNGLVANVVYKSSSWGGTWRWTPELRPQIDDSLYSGEISVNGQSGRSNITLTLANDGFRQGHWGPEFRSDPDGTATVRRDERATYYNDRPKLSATLARTATNGNVLNLNASGQIVRFTQRVLGDVAGPAPFTSTEDYKETQNDWIVEAGGDYEFGLGGGQLKLIGLQRFHRTPFRYRFTSLDDASGSAAEGDRYAQDVDELESIARAEYRWKAGKADWQISLEGALNSLDSVGRYAILQPDGSYSDIPLAGANARVAEKRAELVGTYRRPLSGKLSLQANLGAEYSRLSVTGQDILPRNQGYFRPKGSVGISWTPSPATTINAKVERRVDQLSFYDFLASVDLVNDTDRSENPTLVPPQRWRAEIEWAQSLGKWGSIKPYLAYAFVSDIVETIPLSDGTQARGNLPGTRIFLARINGTLQLAPLGVAGAKIDLSGLYVRPTFPDPLTDERRVLSNYTHWDWSVNFRHDIPRSDLAWGVGSSRTSSYSNYLLNQVITANSSKPDLNLFVEHKNLGGLTARATVYNLLGQTDDFARTVYVDRRGGPVLFREARAREYGRVWSFSLSGKI